MTLLILVSVSSEITGTGRGFAVLKGDLTVGFSSSPSRFVNHFKVSCLRYS